MSSLECPVPASKTVNLLVIRLTATDPAACLKGKPGDPRAQGSPNRGALAELGGHEPVAQVELGAVQQIAVTLPPDAAVEVCFELRDRLCGGLGTDPCEHGDAVPRSLVEQQLRAAPVRAPETVGAVVRDW